MEKKYLILIIFTLMIFISSINLVLADPCYCAGGTEIGSCFTTCAQCNGAACTSCIDCASTLCSSNRYRKLGTCTDSVGCDQFDCGASSYSCYDDVTRRLTYTCSGGTCGTYTSDSSCGASSYSCLTSCTRRYTYTCSGSSCGTYTTDTNCAQNQWCSGTSCTGTSYCGYSSYNGCSADICDKTRDAYRCTSGASCSYDTGDNDQTPVASGKYCSGGNEVTGSCGSTTCSESDTCYGTCGTGTNSCVWWDYTTCSKYCNGAGTCASCTCTPTEYDLDSSQTYCTSCKGAPYWNLGGNVSATTCCGDDAEYNLTRVCNSGICTNSTSDDGCCASSSQCIYNSNCYSDGYTGDASGDGWDDKCTAGIWRDGGKPRWSANVTSPISPVTYSSGATYKFNATWQDNIAVDDVIFEFNSVNYSYKKNQLNKSGSVYNITITDLAANPSGYTYKWYANDTTNNWNSTSLSYVINKASSSLSLSGTGAYEYATQTTVTGSDTNTVDSGCSYGLYRNDSSVSNPDIQTLVPGIYNYTYNNSACTNFTAGIISSFLNITLGTLTVKCEAGGPYVSGATVIVKGNVTNSSGIAKISNVYVTIGSTTKQTTSDTNGTFYLIFSALTTGTYTVRFNSSATYYTGSCEDTLQVLASSSTACTQKTIQILGNATDAGTGRSISSGRVIASILDTTYTNSAAFSDGQFSISLDACLFKGKRYTVQLAIKDSNSAKSALSFLTYTPS